MLKDEITRTSIDLCGTKSAMIQDETLARSRTRIQDAGYGRKDDKDSERVKC